MEAKLNKVYTYRDYVTLNDRKRYELINGELYLLASPSEIHQRVVGNLFGHLWQFFRDKPCNVYMAPFDVLFGEEKEFDVRTVLQPDIFVVCDKSKLDSKRYCKGAPDFVIEVLSPSSVTADFVLKYNIYERYDVKEYWIVSPDEEKIIVFRKESEGKFGKAIIYEKGKIISTTLFEDLLIDVDEVFK